MTDDRIRKKFFFYPRHSISCHGAGFTLVEMSIVLVVIGLIILIVFPALNAVRTNAQRSATDTNLQALLRATAAFAQANGCLPCPTPADIYGSGFGRVRGDTVTAACNVCNSPEGIPPFVSLGVPMSMAKDGWGRWITMRVDPALTVSSMAGIIPSGQVGLCAANLNKANRIGIVVPGGATQAAAVIFVSHGPNGYGSYAANPLSGDSNGWRLSFPSGTTACASGGYERCNADGDLTFYNAPSVFGGNNPFDDILLFLDRNALVSLFGNGSCQTAW